MLDYILILRFKSGSTHRKYDYQFFEIEEYKDKKMILSNNFNGHDAIFDESTMTISYKTPFYGNEVTEKIDAYLIRPRVGSYNLRGSIKYDLMEWIEVDKDYSREKYIKFTS